MRRSWLGLPILGPLLDQYLERLTPRGRYLLWLAAAFALLGLDTRRTQIFVLFAVLAGLFLVALLLVLLARPRGRLTCRLPEKVTAGRAIALSAQVAPGGGALPDLLFSFPWPKRWRSSVQVTPRQQLLSAPEGAPRELGFTLRLARRGRYVLRQPTLRAVDPLGLLAGPAARSREHVLLAYPPFYSMAEFQVPLGRRYQPGGIPLTSSTGDAVEFVGTRDYREGDPIRNIHWRSWARRGAPVVKEYQEEYFCRIALVLDTFLPVRAEAAETRSFEASISVLASIADFFSRSEYIVDVLAAGPDLYQVSAGRSLAYLENILEVLACLEPCYAPPFESVGPPLFQELQQITTVVAVLQDWDDAREGFLRRIKSLGTEVKVLVVREGETARPWRAVGPDLGQLEQVAPSDVERALALAEGEAPTGGAPVAGGRLAPALGAR